MLSFLEMFSFKTIISVILDFVYRKKSGINGKKSEKGAFYNIF